MAALQLGNPLACAVLMKFPDAAIHGIAAILLYVKSIENLGILQVVFDC